MYSNIDDVKKELKELCLEYVTILEKLKDELISSITELATQSENHENMFKELHSKINNVPLKNVKTKVLERMKEMLEKIEVPTVEQQSENELDEEQTELFDEANPPIANDFEKKWLNDWENHKT